MAVKYIVNQDGGLHKRVVEIMQQCNELEVRKAQLQQELVDIQAQCQHSYVESSFLKTCCKCQYTEGIY
jgi:hypothetical protein